MAVRGAEELTQEEYDKRVKDVRSLLHCCICRAACSLMMWSLLIRSLMEPLMESAPLLCTGVSGTASKAGTGCCPWCALAGHSSPRTMHINQ